MSSRRDEPTPPAWTDLVLAAMGLILVGAFGVGLLSSIPLRVAGSAGSVLATATWVGSVAVNPDDRTAGSD
jgi:hypothetical protein